MDRLEIELSTDPRDRENDSSRRKKTLITVPQRLVADVLCLGRRSWGWKSSGNVSFEDGSAEMAEAIDLNDMRSVIWRCR